MISIRRLILVLMPLSLCAMGPFAGCRNEDPPAGEYLDAVVLDDGTVVIAGTEGLLGAAIPVVTQLTAAGLPAWTYQLGTDVLGSVGNGGLGSALATDPSGRVYAAGSAIDGSASRTGVVARLNGLGAPFWEVAPFAAFDESDLLDIEVSGDGVFVTGGVSNPSSPADAASIVVAKLELLNGSTAWATTLASGLDLDDLGAIAGLGLTLGPSGQVGISGLAVSADGGSDWFAAVLDDAGNVTWTSRLDGPDDLGAEAGSLNAALEARFDVAGNLFVTGVIFPGDEGSNARLLKYDPSGSIEWDRSRDADIGVEQASFDQARAVAVSSDRVWMAGALASRPAGTLVHEGFVQSYDGAGNLQWERGFAGTSTSGDEVLDLVADGTDAVYAVGYSSDDGLGKDLAIEKFDASGNRVWARQFDVLGGARDQDRFHRVLLDDSGAVYGVGTVTFVAGVESGAVVKLNPANGTVQWSYPPAIFQLPLSRSTG